MTSDSAQQAPYSCTPVSRRHFLHISQKLSKRHQNHSRKQQRRLVANLAQLLQMRPAHKLVQACTTNPAQAHRVHQTQTLENLEHKESRVFCETMGAKHLRPRPIPTPESQTPSKQPTSSKATAKTVTPLGVNILHVHHRMLRTPITTGPNTVAHTLPLSASTRALWRLLCFFLNGLLLCCEKLIGSGEGCGVGIRGRSREILQGLALGGFYAGFLQQSHHNAQLCSTDS